MSEPTTKAGRALAARAKSQAWGNWEGIAQFDIPAIEREVREDIARQVAGLPTEVMSSVLFGDPAYRPRPVIAQSAVLALLQAPDPLEGRTDE